MISNARISGQVIPAKDNKKPIQPIGKTKSKKYGAQARISIVNTNNIPGIIQNQQPQPQMTNFKTFYNWNTTTDYNYNIDINENKKQK